MPVTRLHPSAAPVFTPSGPAPAAPMPASGSVGHGTTGLIARPPAYRSNGYVPSDAPPPTQETAGMNKGRTSIRQAACRVGGGVGRGSVARPPPGAAPQQMP